MGRRRSASPAMTRSFRSGTGQGFFLLRGRPPLLRQRFINKRKHTHTPFMGGGTQTARWEPAGREHAPRRPGDRGRGEGSGGVRARVEHGRVEEAWAWTVWVFGVCLCGAFFLLFSFLSFVWRPGGKE